MTLQERLRMFRGDRSEGLLERGERAQLPVARSSDPELERLALDLGLPYHDESLRRDAAEQRWRMGLSR